MSDGDLGTFWAEPHRGGTVQTTGGFGRHMVKSALKGFDSQRIVGREVGSAVVLAEGYMKVTTLASAQEA